MRTKLLAGCASLFLAISISAWAQSNPSSVPRWATVVHQEAMAVHDPSSLALVRPGVFPHVFGRTFKSFDPSGVVETYNLAAPTVTKHNPFFQSLGTNGRACVTCHEPRSAWSVSAT